MRNFFVFFAISTMALSASALSCDTEEGTRVVRDGQLVSDLTTAEELSLEDEIGDVCDHGISYTSFYHEIDDQEPLYKVDLTCHRDSGPFGRFTLELDCH